jgi:hypothetical protein
MAGACEYCGADLVRKDYEGNRDFRRRRFCDKRCKKLGQPYKGRTIEQLAERFWGQVDKSKECWEWAGLRMPKGYGEIGFRGKHQLAHRISWDLAFGSVITVIIRHASGRITFSWERIPRTLGMLRPNAEALITPIPKPRLGERTAHVGGFVVRRVHPQY